ncbi:MAG TPA: DNA mismatch repair protein MutS [Bacillota bacterium]|nr:DNA mismatch repair protein MutS [Bacillota bacterium]
MAFKSILFQGAEAKGESVAREAPAYFKDLNLDQIIDAATAGRKEYDLTPYFFTPLHSESAVRYRQDVMRELGDESLRGQIKTYAGQLYQVAETVARMGERIEKSEGGGWNYLEKGRLLEAAGEYCETVEGLARDIASFDPNSQGLRELGKYVSNYKASDAFTLLRRETEKMREALSAVQYCMLIKGNSIKVKKYEGEADLTPEIEKVFQKFREGAVKDYRQKIPEDPYAEHVEAGVLNLVAGLYPDIFSGLNQYCAGFNGFVDETLSLFSREVQFYLAYLEYMEKFKPAGLRFCYPKVSGQDKEIRSLEGFDLALAGKLIRRSQPVVCNDFYLKGKERIIVVSGPNQGGKTTFARVFGQLHHLASLGCPVAGKEARLFLPDRIFTHFEKEEDIRNFSGKLQDDLVRMNEILDGATTGSIILINEILSSTSLKDAVDIGKRIMEELVELDALCVCVTFLDELASCSEKNVSMVSTVVPEDPVRRTYKIVRKPADGLAYAMHLAEKYRLTYDCIKERIKA